MSKNNGGFAFPKAHLSGYLDERGMTLRQYYAGQAIAGVCNRAAGLHDEAYMKVIATRAFQMADSMIEAETTKGKQ